MSAASQVHAVGLNYIQHEAGWGAAFWHHPSTRTYQELCDHMIERRIRLCGVCEMAHSSPSPVQPWDPVTMDLGELGWFNAWPWFDEWRARPEVSSLANPVNHLQQ